MQVWTVWQDPQRGQLGKVGLGRGAGTACLWGFRNRDGSGGAGQLWAGSHSPSAMCGHQLCPCLSRTCSRQQRVSCSHLALETIQMLLLQTQVTVVWRSGDHRSFTTIEVRLPALETWSRQGVSSHIPRGRRQRPQSRGTTILMPYRDCRAQVWIFKLSEHLKPDVVVENVRFASREYLSCLSPVPLVMGSLRRLDCHFPLSLFGSAFSVQTRWSVSLFVEGKRTKGSGSSQDRAWSLLLILYGVSSGSSLASWQDSLSSWLPGMSAACVHRHADSKTLHACPSVIGTESLVGTISWSHIFLCDAT